MRDWLASQMGDHHCRKSPGTPHPFAWPHCSTWVRMCNWMATSWSHIYIEFELHCSPPASKQLKSFSTKKEQPKDKAGRNQRIKTHRYFSHVVSSPVTQPANGCGHTRHWFHVPWSSPRAGMALCEEGRVSNSVWPCSSGVNYSLQQTRHFGHSENFGDLWGVFFCCWPMLRPCISFKMHFN